MKRWTPICEMKSNSKIKYAQCVGDFCVFVLNATNSEHRVYSRIAVQEMASFDEDKEDIWRSDSYDKQRLTTDSA